MSAAPMTGLDWLDANERAGAALCEVVPDVRRRHLVRTRLAQKYGIARWVDLPAYIVEGIAQDLEGRSHDERKWWILKMMEDI